jgi:hypothetical protein
LLAKEAANFLNNQSNTQIKSKPARNVRGARTASTRPNLVMGRLLGNAVFFSSLLLFLKRRKERHG